MKDKFYKISTAIPSEEQNASKLKTTPKASISNSDRPITVKIHKNDKKKIRPKSHTDINLEFKTEENLWLGFFVEHVTVMKGDTSIINEE